jgi:cell surface protein SprA
LATFGVGIALANNSFFSTIVVEKATENVDKKTTTASQNKKKIGRDVLDTIPLRDRTGDYLRDSVRNPFFLPDPEVVEKNVEYDPKSNRYYVTERIGDDYFRTPTSMTFDEYAKWKGKQQEQAYFDRLSGKGKVSSSKIVDPLTKINFTQTQNTNLKLLLDQSGKLNPLDYSKLRNAGDWFVKQVIGDPPSIDIRTQGNIDLTLGYDYHRYKNPILPLRSQTTGGLLFDMNIQFNVTGKIGQNIDLNTAFNNRATFDFDRLIKLNYNPQFGANEDKIFQKFEAGNVSLPLRGTLIQGSQNLFGLKTELKFGHLRLTALGAQQQSRQQNIKLQGGAQVQQFSVQADQYDENRHFFITHYNRGHFEESLAELPQVKSLFTIQEIEVWMSNERNETQSEVRQVVALTDLGEPVRLTSPNVTTNPNRKLDPQGVPLPYNGANSLDSLFSDSLTRRLDRVSSSLQSSRYNLKGNQDFVKMAARKLSQNEYTFNPQLGTLSVSNVDRGQVLGVSVRYYYNGSGPDATNPDIPYQIGEFSGDAPPYFRDSTSRVMYTKMVKSTGNIPGIPLWDLMMKNVYAVNAFVQQAQDFRLDVYYQDPKSKDKADKRILSESPLNQQPILRLLGLDRLNTQGDPQPDGTFDFIPGLTINVKNGRIMFPVLEPFGRSLGSKITGLGGDSSLIRKYTYNELYDSTLFRAQERAEKNRFMIRGTVKSTVSSSISLGTFGLKPDARITVTAGGRLLTQGADYEVDYGIGTIRILNAAYLAPDLPINVSFEDQTLFSFQTRYLLGLRADYDINKDFSIGATYLNLFEQPFTQKVNTGEDPINNSIYGIDLRASRDAQWLTKALDKLPFYSTKEMSRVNLTAEAAWLNPGHARGINNDALNEKGLVYVDDFEGGTSSFNLMTAPQTWAMASTPQQHEWFPETRINDATAIWGANRALLNWYQIDPSVLRNVQDPTNIYAINFTQQEIFKNRSTDPTNTFGLRTFDLTYYPKERGPYNFDPPSGYPNISSGVARGNRLKDPQTRWGGIMRGLQNTDFEAANFEYIDIWMLDPSINDQARMNEGQFVIQLGSVSEDILPDSRRSYENGLPKSATDVSTKTDRTKWGRVPRTEVNLPRSFDADPDVRNAQDIGLDGLDDAGEQSSFSNYINELRSAGILTPEVETDPANDNFLFFNDSRFQSQVTTARDRYLRNNNTQGNSSGSTTSTIQQFSTNVPDNEDVNGNNTFEEAEAYYEYRLPIVPKPNDREGILPNDYLVEEIDGLDTRKKWYHYRVPLDKFTGKYGQIDGFRNIRFARVLVRGFQDTVTLRFARFDLVRNTWRRYRRDLSKLGAPTLNPNPDNTLFEVNSVNVEDNGSRTPFNYVLPPGIIRENAVQTFAANAQQNEQALSMRVCNLQSGNAKAAFKLSQIDLRLYERLKMFLHAEELGAKKIPKGATSVFVRIGSDFEQNYYEYEIPLTMSDKNALPQGDAYRTEVWKAENNMDLRLGLLTDLKEQRNRVGSASTLFSIVDPENPNRTARIIGNPSLGQVRGFMIGIRNNDQTDHCFEVWANELRVTGINEQGGGAAIARMDVKLADLGNLTLSGNYMGVGYGGLEQRVQQRSLEEVIQYDISANLELGKFLPEKAGIRLPFFAQYSNTINTPKYDPYDLDLNLKSKINSVGDAAARDSIRDAAITQQALRTISFTNIRKDRTRSDKKPMPWDIENFSATYAQTQTERKDPIIASDKKDAYRGGLDYNFSREIKYWTPFKKAIKKDKYLKLISEFNLNPLPNSIAINNLLDRQLSTTTYRFAGEDPRFNTYYLRRFMWDRNYNSQWDLTKSLKLTFDAKTQSVVDELNDFNTLGAPASDEEKRQEIVKNIKSFGRTKRYDQNVNVNYTLPFKYVPFMEWINVRGTYTSTYGWEASARNLQSGQVLTNAGGQQITVDAVGNSIKNSQNRSINGELNFDNLYSYSGYLRKINAPRVLEPSKTKKPKRRRNKEDGAVIGKELDDEVPTDPMDQQNKQLDPNGTPPVSDGANGGAQGKTKGKKEKKPKSDEPSAIERILLRPVMMLKKARINYTEQFTSFVPGFTPQAGLFGQSALNSPGWAYNMGWQTGDRAWLDQAGDNGWISNNPFQNRAALNTYSQNIDGRFTLEPYPDFRIELEANRQYSSNRSEEFRDTTLDLTRRLSHTAAREMGALTVSYFTLNTMFKNVDDVFDNFKNNRSVVSNLLSPNGLPHKDTVGFRQGYGPSQRDVLTQSFLAAYTGKTPEQVSKSVFNTIPKLNWKLTYNGLSKLPFFRDYFQSFSLQHGYKSTLTVAQYNNELNFSTVSQRIIPQTNDYYAEYNIPSIVINEQFQPLIGVDMRLKNDFSFNMNWQKSRTLILSVGDKKLVENNVNQITIGAGHRLKNFVIPFLTPKAQRAPKKPRKPKKGETPAVAPPTDPNGKAAPTVTKGNDLEFKFDLTYRDDKQANREIEQDIVVPTRGSKTLRVSPSVRYSLNKSLDLRLFGDYDYMIPATTASFPTYNFRGGLVVTFKLQ